MAKRLVGIIGAGGHALVVASILMAAGIEVAAFFDDKPSSWGTKIHGIRVAGPVSELSAATCSHAIIGVGNNEARKRLAEQVDIEWITAVHPFSWVHPGVSLGRGTVVCAGAVVQPGAQVGSHVILNTKSSVDHDSRVGDYAHIAAAHLAGGASIGEGCLMGLGSVVLPSIQVGAWATVGAGAIVTKDVAPRTTVVGIPASPISR